jgi:hypothetical protein
MPYNQTQQDINPRNKAALASRTIEYETNKHGSMEQILLARQVLGRLQAKPALLMMQSNPQERLWQELYFPLISVFLGFESSLSL